MACNLGILDLHDQCIDEPGIIPSYGRLVTRVDGGYINQRLVYTMVGIQAREGEFVPDKNAGNQYIPASIFDMAIGDEMVLGMTMVPFYDWLVRATVDGWDYYPLLTIADGSKQARNPVFVPRAREWVTEQFTSPGGDSLEVSGPLPTTNIANEIRVYVGNGAYRTYDPSLTKTEHYSTTGLTTINWRPSWGPFPGEHVSVSILKNVSS